MIFFFDARLLQIYTFLFQNIFPVGMSVVCLVDCTCLVLFFFNFLDIFGLEMAFSHGLWQRCLDTCYISFMIVT